MAVSGGSWFNRRMVIVVAVIVVSSIGLYLWYNRGSPVEYERYDRFGFSFDYPMTLEKGMTMAVEAMVMPGGRSN